MINSSDVSLAPHSRHWAESLFGETRGRTISAVVTDGVNDGLQALIGHRPTRQATMPWVHLGMAVLALQALTVYMASRR